MDKLAGLQSYLAGMEARLFEEGGDERKRKAIVDKPVATGNGEHSGCACIPPGPGCADKPLVLRTETHPLTIQSFSRR